jgi:hypothetical protein
MQGSSRRSGGPVNVPMVYEEVDYASLLRIMYCAMDKCTLCVMLCIVSLLT